MYPTKERKLRVSGTDEMTFKKESFVGTPSPHSWDLSR